MDRRQIRIADQLFVKRQDGGQFIAAPVEPDAQKADIGDAADQRTQGLVTAFLDDLDGLGAGTLAHALPSGFAVVDSIVNAPEAVATGSPSSSSWAVARTKATVRLAWKHSARAMIRCPGFAARM